MKAHELARKLLSLPDEEVIVYDPSERSRLGTIDHVYAFCDDRHKDVECIELMLEL